MSEELESTFQRTVDQGHDRLSRTWPSLVATGLVGGIDVSLGVLALLIVERATGRPLLGALAFIVGFMALTLANSELFTENFLVPVASVAAGNGTVPDLLRLWLGTLVANLAGASWDWRWPGSTTWPPPPCIWPTSPPPSPSTCTPWPT